MQHELKYQIIAAAKEYAKANHLSNNDIATKTKINSSYLSNMFRDQFTIPVNGKEVEIADKWFFKLAEFCNLPVNKQYWPIVQTRQFIEVVASLEAAKKSGRISVLICDTGAGKTFTVDKFVYANPTNTYKITVSDSHNLKDILLELTDQLNIPQNFRTYAILKTIASKFKEMAQNGLKPIVIIDEAENLKWAAIRSLKALYDLINGYASLCLIGTSQLTKKLDYMRKKDRAGVPQFCRRIKSAIRTINTQIDFTPFFKLHDVEKPLQRLLNATCDNYGELHDYLEPALREADQRDEPLTEQLFRLMYNMPNYN